MPSAKGNISSSRALCQLPARPSKREAGVGLPDAMVTAAAEEPRATVR